MWLRVFKTLWVFMRILRMQLKLLILLFKKVAHVTSVVKQLDDCVMKNKELSRADVRTINQAKGLAKFLSVDICIKIFGVTIWEYHFPPKVQENA